MSSFMNSNPKAPLNTQSKLLQKENSELKKRLVEREENAKTYKEKLKKLKAQVNQLQIQN